MWKKGWKTTLLGLIPILLMVLKSMTGIEVIIPGTSNPHALVDLTLAGGLLFAADANRVKAKDRNDADTDEQL